MVVVAVCVMSVYILPPSQPFGSVSTVAIKCWYNICSTLTHIKHTTRMLLEAISMSGEMLCVWVWVRVFFQRQFGSTLWMELCKLSIHFTFYNIYIYRLKPWAWTEHTPYNHSDSFPSSIQCCCRCTHLFKTNTATTFLSWIAYNDYLFLKLSEVNKRTHTRKENKQRTSYFQSARWNNFHIWLYSRCTVAFFSLLVQAVYSIHTALFAVACDTIFIRWTTLNYAF